MELRHTLIGGAVLLLTATIVAGCGSDTPTQANNNTPLMRTIPPEGYSDFDVSAPIHMMFNEPVDIGQLEEMFYCLDSATHLALEDTLHDGMMGMGNHHQDSAMFYDRMHARSIKGTFVWNNMSDSCVFQPMVELLHDTEYVLRIRHDLSNHHGNRMHDMGEPLSDDPIVRFRTHKPR